VGEVDAEGGGGGGLLAALRENQIDSSKNILSVFLIYDKRR